MYVICRLVCTVLPRKRALFSSFIIIDDPESRARRRNNSKSNYTGPPRIKFLRPEKLYPNVICIKSSGRLFRNDTRSPRGKRVSFFRYIFLFLFFFSPVVAAGVNYQRCPRRVRRTAWFQSRGGSGVCFEKIFIIFFFFKNKRIDLVILVSSDTVERL